MKSVEEAVAEAIPHNEECPSWKHVTKCLCDANKRRAVLLAHVSLATNQGRVYLR